MAGVCELGGKLYCIGGWNGQVGIRQCDMFDPDTQQWTTVAPLQTGRPIYYAVYNNLIDKILNMCVK